MSEDNFETLVVDLDGTLIKSDLLHETFWSATSRCLWAPLIAVRKLFSGRCALKAWLAEVSEVDFTTLPYRPEVIAYVEAWRSRGGKAFLVSASNELLVERVSAHLGIFDGFYGSTHECNLKGKEKARFIQAAFSGRDFCYVGDSAADLHVWRNASKAVLVEVDQGLQRKLEAYTCGVEVLTPKSWALKEHLRTLRPHQWAKNLLVATPMVAGHAVSVENLWLTALAFASFSAIASGVYVLNDLLDLSSDRKHISKRYRPYAAGVADIRGALVVAPVLLLVGFLIASFIGSTFLVTVACYFVLTCWYSLSLKRKPILDVVILAVLFTLRVLAGGVATGTLVSFWLIAFSVFVFFFLASVKRHTELIRMRAIVENSGERKIAGRGYYPSDATLIQQFSVVSGLISVLIFALYINVESVKVLYSSPTLLWGGCLILLFWVSYILLVTHRDNMTDDPIVFALTDRTSLVSVALLGACVLFASLI